MRVGLFPGQGLPARTILDALPADSPLVDRASEILSYDLRARVAAVAKRERSVLPTSLAQPALFTASLVNWQTHKGESFDLLIGHSLGEYAALVAGGSLSFLHGLCAVQVRGETMETAARQTSGGMAAILGLDLSTATDIAERCGVEVANDNDPFQAVVAGGDEGLVEVAAMVKALGARCVRLEVTAPFHTSAMAPAQPFVQAALEHSSVKMPVVPIVSNVTARPYRAPGEIRKLLVDQMVSRVRFRESVEYAWATGAREFIDLGPGRVVAKLAARTVDEISAAVA